MDNEKRALFESQQLWRSHLSEFQLKLIPPFPNMTFPPSHSRGPFCLICKCPKIRRFFKSWENNLPVAKQKRWPNKKQQCHLCQHEKKTNGVLAPGWCPTHSTPRRFPRPHVQLVTWTTCSSKIHGKRTSTLLIVRHLDPLRSTAQWINETTELPKPWSPSCCDSNFFEPSWSEPEHPWATRSCGVKMMLQWTKHHWSCVFLAPGPFHRYLYLSACTIHSTSRTVSQYIVRWDAKYDGMNELVVSKMCRSFDKNISVHGKFQYQNMRLFESFEAFFCLWWNGNHCVRMSLPALLAEICSPEIAAYGRWIKWLSWCLWNSGEQTNPAQGAMPKAWCQNRDWFKGECPLCPFHAAKQTIYAQGIISKLKTSWWEGMASSEDNFGKFTKKLGACDHCWWWFLVVASQIWSHRQLPTKQRSWCPVGVQVSLMLLVVEELVGCASPFLDQDSTLICRCVKSTLLAFYQPKNCVKIRHTF